MSVVGDIQLRHVNASTEGRKLRGHIGVLRHLSRGGVHDHSARCACFDQKSSKSTARTGHEDDGL
jgi:hypothetical protein